MNSIPKSIREKLLDLEGKIFSPMTGGDFDNMALEIFKIQALYCKPYSRYLELLEIDPDKINSPGQIPFLPVSIFKSHDIRCFEGSPEAIFTSSATTGMTPSSHPVKSLGLYKKSFTETFRLFFGEPSNYNILALLPSYLEREGSSLVYMMESLIDQSSKNESGFYLYNFDHLYNKLRQLRDTGQKCILLGVTFALLDFAERHSLEYPGLTVIETGGMKGRKKEVSRSEVHSILKKAFGVGRIGSEYGMAELMSQAWSFGEGLFHPSPRMRVVIRDLNDPFRYRKPGRSGGVNIIDLANLYSCSFIETEDMGIKEAGESFRITGRINNSEIRGCNLLLEG